MDKSEELKLQNLPEELRLKIISFLDVQSRARYACTHKQANNDINEVFKLVNELATKCGGKLISRSFNDHMCDILVLTWFKSVLKNKENDFIKKMLSKISKYKKQNENLLRKNLELIKNNYMLKSYAQTKETNIKRKDSIANLKEEYKSLPANIEILKKTNAKLAEKNPKFDKIAAQKTVDLLNSQLLSMPNHIVNEEKLLREGQTIEEKMKDEYLQTAVAFYSTEKTKKLFVAKIIIYREHFTKETINKLLPTKTGYYRIDLHQVVGNEGHALGYIINNSFNNNWGAIFDPTYGIWKFQTSFFSNNGAVSFLMEHINAIFVKSNALSHLVSVIEYRKKS